MNITIAGWSFLFFITALLPIATIRAARKVRASGRVPTRKQYLVSVAILQATMLILALATAVAENVVLFPTPSFGVTNVVVVLAFLVPALGTLPLRWRWKPRDEQQRLLWMLPNRLTDIWWWTLVALAAGTVEEIVYRGVMATIWKRVFGSWWAAVAICVVAFALAHFAQGWRAVLVILLLATGSHLVVRATGDLYTAMIIHVIYDLLAGLVLLRLAQRDGLVPRSAPTPAIESAGH
jgi:membrane protease YdiL (CAAX protease family)